MLTLPVFYHSSTIIIVDDNELFLKVVAKMLEPEFRVKTFKRPNECLDFLREYTSPLSKNNFLRSCIELENQGTGHSFVDFDVPALGLLQHNPLRNEEISVMIVDFNMPDINGIELCRSLNSLPIKKILLTAEVQCANAVAAFNDHIIDRFIRKDSSSLAMEIKGYVSALTYQYYREHTSALLSHLEIDQKLPLSDPLFVNFFQQWCIDNSIKEYTLIDKNGSLMLLDKNDQYKYFVIHTNHTLNSFIELNADVDEATSFLDQIKARQKIPFFGIGKESWEFEANNWHPFFYEAEKFSGRNEYFWVVVDADSRNAEKENEYRK